eukprot:gene23988-30275_t
MAASQSTGFDQKHQVNNDFNYIGSIVENVSKAMKTGAVLEIEWLPTFSRGPFPKPVSGNPFSGYYTLMEASNAISHIHMEFQPKEERDKVNKDGLMAPNMQLVEKIRALLLFHHEVLGIGASVRQLAERMFHEQVIETQLMMRQNKVHLRCNLRADPCEKVISCLQSCFFENFPETDCFKLFEFVNDPGGQRVSGYVYSLQDFIAHSYVNIVLTACVAQTNAPR